MWIRVAAAKRVAVPGNDPSRPVSKKGASVARRCCFRVRLDEMVLNTKEAWASKLRARLIDLTVPPAK
jgi:hypothetical protein